MPRIPVIDQAAMIVPMPLGPRLLGTTSVQSSVIVHVISWPPAMTVTLRPTRLPAASASGPLLKEGQRVVDHVAQRFFGPLADLLRGDSADDRQRRDVARHDGSGRYDRAAADRDPGEDRRARPDEDVVLDPDRPRLHAELRIVDRMEGAEDGDVGRDAHVLADAQRAAGVEAAVPVDPRVRADRQAAAAQLAGPVEPHVAAEVNRRSLGELDPEHTAVPGVPE